MVALLSVSSSPSFSSKNYVAFIIEEVSFQFLSFFHLPSLSYYIIALSIVWPVHLVEYSVGGLELLLVITNRFLLYFPRVIHT